MPTHALSLPSPKRGIELIHTCRFDVRTREEVAIIIGFLQEWFASRPQALEGIEALLHNGLEHGLLGLGEQEKARRLADGSFDAFVQQGLARLAPEQRVDLTLTRKDNGTYIVIQDSGAGFHWKPYLNVDPTRANQPNGRGIAYAAHRSFDKLTYNEKGNQAVAFIADR